MNPEPEAGDAGRPIRILREQEHDTSSDFVNRVRNRIHRRAATTQAAAFSWHLPKVALLEMARLLTHLVASVGARKDSQS
jgi:hypothetical protein